MPTRTKTETTARTDAEIPRDVKRRMKADFEVPENKCHLPIHPVPPNFRNESEQSHAH